MHIFGSHRYKVHHEWKQTRAGFVTMYSVEWQRDWQSVRPLRDHAGAQICLTPLPWQSDNHEFLTEEEACLYAEEMLTMKVVGHDHAVEGHARRTQPYYDRGH